jgi:tetratricopeptide (TPR) repeat protein
LEQANKEAETVRCTVEEFIDRTISSYYNMQVTGNLDKSIQIYQEWLANYPHSVGALVNMGQAYAEEGQYEKGIELAQRACKYEKSNIVYGNIALYQIKLNRFDEARKTLEEAGSLNFDDDAMHVNSYRLAFLQDDEHGMDEHASWFDAKPEYQSEMLRVRSQRTAYAGHMKQAREFTVRAVDTSQRVDNIESAAFAHTDSALREALYGNFPLARREAAAALALAHDSRAVEREAGLAYVLAGDSTHAQAIANDLAKNLPEDTIVQSVVLPAIRAKLEIDRNHPDQAITLLESARPYEFGDILNGCAYSAYLRAQALLRSGKPSPAADDFRRILDHRGVVLSCPTGAAARLGLARALKMQAGSDRAASTEREQAREAYRNFFHSGRMPIPISPF